MSAAPSEQQLNGPALQPPPGILPNLTNPPNHNALGIAVLSVCLFLATIAALLRAYSRGYVSRKLHIEDALGLAAFGFYAALAWGIFEYTRVAGILVHQWNISLRNLVNAGHASYFITFLYTFAMLFGKTAILIEWTRIFATFSSHRNFLYIATRAIIALNVVVYTLFSFLFIFFCYPVVKNWKAWVPGRCLDHRPHDLAIVSINVLLDIFILVLPQRFIWSLKMPLRRKIGFSIVFSVGLLACASAIGRFVLATSLDYQGDITYELAKTFLFAFVEVTCVLLVFCVPAIPRAFSPNTFLFAAVVAVRSWTQRLTTYGSHERLRPHEPEFPPTIGREPNAHIKRFPDDGDQGLSLADLTLDGQDGDLERADHRSFDPSQQGSAEWEQQGGHRIVVTREVDQRAETGSRAAAQRSIERRQHNWA
ncbi:hypothetical protein F5Y01DRAFT_328623 [Xylaria sp. FL0043]|nr:hypothetical protein F5Y01DRAFT_328623 [Xylaria sp. FL0043]